MESIKLNIQMFDGGSTDATGADFASMTQGISQSGIMSVYQQINSVVVQESEEALRDYAAFFQALDLGWSGGDREVFKQNFITLVDEIIEKLNEYDAAIRTQFEHIVNNWNEFQNTNVTAR